MPASAHQPNLSQDPVSVSRAGELLFLDEETVQPCGEGVALGGFSSRRRPWGRGVLGVRGLHQPDSGELYLTHSQELLYCSLLFFFFFFLVLRVIAQCVEMWRSCRDRDWTHLLIYKACVQPYIDYF